MTESENQSQPSAGSSAPAGPRVILSELERATQSSAVERKILDKSASANKPSADRPIVEDEPQELVSEAMRKLDDILVQWKQKGNPPPG